uniref:Alpha-L-glutamate ligase-related protein ATP-grasp domain-containing protein n=1 Tax=Phaeomonas parva TaxID=124430 RepID=A0A7S1UG28_9STRA|mmetsp:Transcript_45630/g.142839  ORF Transcript_45630/g.142839 Transcript_45630/m.142839 type:complete len:443 (+) Transcript_45630:241-1569(+)
MAAPECQFVSNGDGILSLILRLLKGIVAYYAGLGYYVLGGSLNGLSLLQSYPKRTRVHLYFLALNFWLWKKPHYRTGTHQGDMLKNLRNVAIPGTGVPLHLFVYFRVTALFFLVAVYPAVAAVSAVNRARVELDKSTGLVERATWAAGFFLEQLLTPEDWFTYWRMNSSLASYHSLLSGAEGYRFENKWDFLRDGAALDVPVSPFLDMSDLVIKDRNEEGGMGIFFYKNATEGGDWIIQRRLHNGEAVQQMLPDNAPLSTFRVMTASSWSAKQVAGKGDAAKAGDCVKALSCVFRAGRAGASTDHSSILFDVDTAKAELGRGTTNDHWYQLGLHKALKCDWLSTHDQTDAGGVPVTGKKLLGCQEMLDMCVDSHYQMLKDVPLVGWDVAICAPPDEGQWLLEVNLSCNFFRGSFDKDKYFDFLEEYLVALEPLKAKYRNKSA